jgi:D-aminopeptidase
MMKLRVLIFLCAAVVLAACMTGVNGRAAEAGATATAASVAAASNAPAHSRAIAASGPYAKAPALGIHLGTLPHGEYDAITDVAGVTVGQVTHSEGSGKLVPGVGPVRTGITGVIPRPDIWHHRVYAAVWPLNGNGEMTGSLWVNESGFLETPIVLTDSLSVGRVDDGVISWMIEHNPKIGNLEDVPLPVVAEVNDDFLNDQQGRHNLPKDAVTALDSARSGPVAQGDVGAGTGAVAYEFHGGIGTASRVVPKADGGYTVGVLVNANTFERRQDFTVDGVPVGANITDLRPVSHRSEGSIIIVVATDAPVSPLQLVDLAKHAALGLARTGGSSREGSGDIIIAFSTANVVPYDSDRATFTPTEMDRAYINPVFVATIESTDEAVVNALLASSTMVGRDGNTIYALPHDRLMQLMHRYGR